MRRADPDDVRCAAFRSTHGLVYLDGASDPTMTPADVGATMPDPATLPRPIKPPPEPDNTSFEALRVTQRSDQRLGFSRSGIASTVRRESRRLGGSLAVVFRDSSGDHGGCSNEARLFGHSSTRTGHLPEGAAVRGSGRQFSDSGTSRSVAHCARSMRRRARCTPGGNRIYSPASPRRASSN